MTELPARTRPPRRIELRRTCPTPITDRDPTRRAPRHAIQRVPPTSQLVPTAQPGPGHQQHDQPVPRRAACPQQRNDLGIAGPTHSSLRLAHPMPSPQPPRHAPVIAPRGFGKVAVISDLRRQRHQTGRGLPGGNRVHHHAPHRGQHTIDPRWRPRRRTARPGQHHRTTARCLGTRGARPDMSQPGHEQDKVFRTATTGRSEHTSAGTARPRAHTPSSSTPPSMRGSCARAQDASHRRSRLGEPFRGGAEVSVPMATGPRRIRSSHQRSRFSGSWQEA